MTFSFEIVTLHAWLGFTVRVLDFPLVIFSFTREYKLFLILGGHAFIMPPRKEDLS